MLDAFIEAESGREQAYPRHARPEEESPAHPPFSVRAIVEKHGADSIHELLRNHDRIPQKIKVFL
jgi:hypothetical protein